MVALNFNPIQLYRPARPARALEITRHLQHTSLRSRQPPNHRYSFATPPLRLPSHAHESITASLKHRPCAAGTVANGQLTHSAHTTMIGRKHKPRRPFAINHKK
jgi:hypothetical protein